MHKCILTASKGLDELLVSELGEIISIDSASIKLQPGQVSFEASLEDIYRVMLKSRLANRVLLILAEGRVKTADDIYQISRQVDWPSVFGNHVPFVVKFYGTNKLINNTQFGALKIKDAIVDDFVEANIDRPNVDKMHAGIVFQGRLRRDLFQLCLDMSGASLHQRGYRQDIGAAPLKETLAAAILMRSAWSPNASSPLLDPMCGSGTIVIEAAQMAARIAPNLAREEWGCDFWLNHDKILFEKVQQQVLSEKQTPKAPIYGFDLSTKAIDNAKLNAARAGVSAYIEFKQCNVLDARVTGTGSIVSNPPYGERLGEYSELLPLFSDWGDCLRQNFQQWSVSLLSSEPALLKALKLRFSKSYKLINGGIDAVLNNYVLSDSNLEVFASNTDDNHEFANRLRKNIKRLKPWLKQANTNAYRVYDADLPHYNVAIDVYADWVVVQEYAPPKNIPAEKSQQRLQEVLLHTPKVLGVAPSKMSVKTRQQNKGSTQYQKLATQGTVVEVHENNIRFLVNPTDYLDVGLFLDHRDTRKLFQAMCANKDVLNLFAYTGSVSVYAAKGGARSVTTVDMSKTYLDWSKRNFAANKLSGAYHFEQADCLQWISETNASFDCIFFDPPSFSNSKRMQQTWDVQRDHLNVLQSLKSRLNQGGKILFSNNLRTFKLDHQGLEECGYQIEHVTDKTIPFDFQRNHKIHQCWILSI